MNKQHYQLLVGEVFVRDTKNDTVQSAVLNAVLRDPIKEITVRKLAKAQQALQMQFLKKSGELMQSGHHEIADCIVHNIVYMGEFTEEEFQAAPEGTRASPVLQ